MKRKAPGTIRSSLPTLQRRRNTTIPGIFSSSSSSSSRRRHRLRRRRLPSKAKPVTELSRLRESPASLDRGGRGNKQLTATTDDGDVGVAHRVDECTDNDNSSSRRTRCPSFSSARRANDTVAAAVARRRRDAFLATTNERAPTDDATPHRAARHPNCRAVSLLLTDYHVTDNDDRSTRLCEESSMKLDTERQRDDNKNTMLV